MAGLPFHISIRPFHIKRQGICGIRIQNQRSFATTFTISGQSEDSRMQFETMPAKVTIPLGQKGAICVRVKRKRPFLGIRRKINFTIHVQSSAGVLQNVPGQLESTPFLSIWQLIFLTLVASSYLLI